VITLRTNAAYFDVDDTLVMWNQAPDHPEAIDMDCFGFRERLVPHKGHIQSLKEHKFRGHTIVVWSAGGAEWAEAIVKCLGLEEYVDVIIGKPDWFYDDLRSDQFMPENIRVYRETYKGRHKGHGDDPNPKPVGTIYAVAHTDIEEGAPVVVQNGRVYPV